MIGYDILIIEPEPPNREFVELDMAEQDDLVNAAKRAGLSILSGFPDYWGELYRIEVHSFPALLNELDQVDAAVQLPPSASSAVGLIRSIVLSAKSRGLPLHVMPD